MKNRSISRFSVTIACLASSLISTTANSAEINELRPNVMPVPLPVSKEDSDQRARYAHEQQEIDTMTKLLWPYAFRKSSKIDGLLRANPKLSKKSIDMIMTLTLVPMMGGQKIMMPDMKAKPKPKSDRSMMYMSLTDSNLEPGYQSFSTREASYMGPIRAKGSLGYTRRGVQKSTNMPALLSASQELCTKFLDAYREYYKLAHAPVSTDSDEAKLAKVRLTLSKLLGRNGMRVLDESAPS